MRPPKSDEFNLGFAPDSLEQLVASMTPEIYENLKQAVELGRWADGVRLSEEQREQSLQLVILYEAKWTPEENRVGAPLQQECASKQIDNDKSEFRPVILDTDSHKEQE